MSEPAMHERAMRLPTMRISAVRTPTRRGPVRLLAAGVLLGIAATAVAPLAARAAAGAPVPSVEDIVDRSIAARGGIKRIRALQSLRETGRLTSGANRQALVMRELKRPNRARFEITVQGVTGVFASDGTKGWKMSPFDGDTEPNPLPESVISEAVEQADIEGPLVDWKAKGHQVELVGREPVGGRDTYKLKMTLKSGAVRYEYLDTKTFLRRRTESTRTLRGHPVLITVTFDDYKKTGGVQFPRRIEVETAGRPQKLNVVIDSIDVNPVLGDDRFEQPSL